MSLAGTCPNCYEAPCDCKSPKLPDCQVTSNLHTSEQFADAAGVKHSPTGGTKNDSFKPDHLLLHQGCPLALAEAIAVMDLGAKKYGRYNWKEVEPDRYHSAMHRHLTAYYIDPTSKDVDTGQSHLSHALCNLLFIVQLEQAGK